MSNKLDMVISALESRLKLLLNEFEFSQDRYRDGLVEFANDSSLDVEFRSAMLFLAVRAKYPTNSEVVEISEMLRLGNSQGAISTLVQKATKRDLCRRLLPSNSVVIDITRYSRNYEISGIPRVVRALLSSEVVKGASHGVWSNQVFGPVSFQEGVVEFPKEIWNAQRTVFAIYYRIRRLLKVRSNKTSRNSLFINLFRVIRDSTPYDFFLRMLNLISPDACLIIGPNTLLVPEVPDNLNSRLLRTWIQAAKIKDSRVIVHDLLPLTHPHFFPPHAHSEHLDYLELLKVSGTLVVGTPILGAEVRATVSGGELQPRISYVPLPISLTEMQRSSKQKKEPLLTFIGGYLPRKGLSKFIDFLAQFESSEIKFKVVVVGSPYFAERNEARRLLKALQSRPEIFDIAESLQDSELVALIKRSAAVIYLSQNEGYGLPILESLYLETPVVALTSPTNLHFQELYGGIHILSEALDRRDLDALNAITNLGEIHKNLLETMNSDSVPNDKEEWAIKVLLS